MAIKWMVNEKKTKKLQIGEIPYEISVSGWLDFWGMPHLQKATISNVWILLQFVATAYSYVWAC